MRLFFVSLLNLRMLCLFVLGISSGLPLLLVGSTFKAWMTEIHLSLAAVGAMALVQLPYSFKFLWAPFMDRYVPPFLDRRRGWILLCQLGLALALFALAFSSPEKRLGYSVALCLMVAFLSASQDVAIDAYRREILEDSEQGLGASVAVNGYRVGLLLAGAGALGIAHFHRWELAYAAMGALLLLAILATVLAPALKGQAPPPATLERAVVAPFTEFFSRPAAFEVLAFIFLFKLGDQMASDMLTPFYLNVGYDKAQIAGVSKVFGLWATIAGGLIGGMILLKVNLVKCLWAFGILQALSTAGFSWLALLPSTSLTALALVVTFENICGGMGTAAYVGFMASLTDKRFTATQYAILSSLMSVPRTLLGSTSGVLSAAFGWPSYFFFCSVIALPGLLLLLRAKRWTFPKSPAKN